MSQLSKRSLNNGTEKRIYEIFTQVLANSSSKDDITSLLYDFLTPTERIMLPKKLCISYLLDKGYDQRAISHYLKVSFTTITKVSTALKNGGKGYKTMLERIRKQETFSAVLTSIESGIDSSHSNDRKKSGVKNLQPQTYAVAHTMSETTPDILPPHS